jgi:hypothetical protein
MLQMKPSGEIVVDENFEVSTGSNAVFGVEDPLFQSAYFRTPTHTVGAFGFVFVPLTIRDMYRNLGASPDQPTTSQVPETSFT